MIVNTRFSENEIKEQLERIINSEWFKRSRQLCKFLRFVVEATLNGENARIKGYTIATEVFNRDETFDPQNDPIVRIEAGRLRRRLEHFYGTAGRHDLIRIEIPKGAYVPVFRGPEPTTHGQEAVKAPIASDARSDQEIDLSKRPSVAVMPLINLNKDEEQDYFVYGLGEELSNHLSLIQGLFVVAHYSMMQYKAKTYDLRQVGRELNVQYIITGSIYRGENRVKLTMQITATRTGEQIWGQRFDIPLTAASLLKLRDEITQKVVSSVAGTYGGLVQTMWKASRGKHVQNLTVYEAVLRTYYYNLKLSSETFAASKLALEHAVIIDPHYARAWAMLAEMHCDIYIYVGNDDNPLEKADECVRKAADLDPSCQYAYYAQSFLGVLEKDRGKTIKAAEAMIALNPNAAFMVGAAGTWLGLVGEYERGIDHIHRSMKMAPSYPGWFHFIPFAKNYRRGDYEQALIEVDKMNLPDWFWKPLVHAATLGQLDRIEQARAAYNELLTFKPDFDAKAAYFINALLMDEVLIEGLFEGLAKAGLKVPVDR
jgi:adenylate cyclase